MWEIYAYQNADSLFGIFNAAATIHGSGDYMAAVAAVAFCGFIAALVAYAFAPEKLQGWKWLATVLLVFSVLIVPRVTVGVVDKTGGSAVKVVANVPFGVAFLGSVTSTVGHTLTGLFETAFQVIPGVGALPSELSYEKNGLMFGNRLIRETGGVAFQDPNFRTDLVNFIHNCRRTSTGEAPWTLVESDDKRYARVKVLRTVCERLEAELARGLPDGVHAGAWDRILSPETAPARPGKSQAKRKSKGQGKHKARKAGQSKKD